MTLHLSGEEARRFLVVRHGLSAPRSLPAKPESVLTVIDRIGLLQFDPLEVPGARNHDLVLHARIDGYRREWCEQWLYGPDRRLFEIYNKSLNIVRIDELPHHSVSWDRHLQRYEAGILQEHADVADNILKRIAAEGPLSTAAFAEHAQSIDWWWAPTRVARAVLEALFVIGRVGISRREGNRRYYDLIERLVPEDLLEKRESFEDGMRHRLLSRFRAAGLTSPTAPPEMMLGTGTASERHRRTAELVDAGHLLPVEVEGIKGLQYVLADEKPLLHWVDERPSVAARASRSSRRWIPFSRIDACSASYGASTTSGRSTSLSRSVAGAITCCRSCSATESSAASSRASIAPRRHCGSWARWEPGFSPKAAEGFVPAMRDALAAYMRFVGARRIDWAPGLGGAARLFGRSPH